MRRLFITIILLTVALASTAFADEQIERLSQARETVKAYCLNEFSGNDPETRERLIKFSPKFEGQFKKEKHKWIAKYVESPQEVVVNAYEIKSVNALGNQATAIVIFKRLARTEKTASSIYVAEPPHDEAVNLNLVFEKNQWWVLDPPPPRISKEVLIEYYQYQVKEDSAMWEQKLNDPTYNEKQKANVRANRDQATGTLRILKSLP